MHKELKTLQNSSTWTLVQRAKGQNVIASKCLFRTKCCFDGTIEHHKVWLVAQDYSKVPILDFFWLFSLVVKDSTICVVLALVVLNN